MGVDDIRLLDGSPAAAQGFSQSRAADRRRTIGRIASLGSVLVALACSLLGAAAALGGTVAPGVVAENPGGTVREVTPGSVAWRDGIRPGQVVLSLASADQPDGWAIETRAGGATIASAVAAQRRLLEGMRPVAVASVALALVALVAVRKSARGAAGIAAVTVALASVPLSIQGEAGLSLVVLALAIVMPSAWFAASSRPPALGIVILVVGVSIAGSWLALRLLGHPFAAQLESIRSASVLAGALLVVGRLSGGLPRMRPRDLGRPRLFDLVSLATLVVLALVLVVASVPLPLVGVAVLVASAAYPAVRRFALRVLDRVILAELRERLTIEAAEAERERLARELHDAPLQELAGVIRRLEGIPQAKPEGDALREVAVQLRGVTIELHPPVLDDLGVVPAIEFLANQHRSRSASVLIAVDVVDQTGLGRLARPPAEIELAVFRIVQEALGNAIQHSRARTVRLEGLVATEQISLSLLDDGIGIGRDTEERALRAGRLGLSSTRRRAEAIGATLRVESRLGQGTHLTLEWQA